jgi:hypothetical protein
MSKTGLLLYLLLLFAAGEVATWERPVVVESEAE